MATRWSTVAAAVVVVGLSAVSAEAALITFTGGTVTRLDGSTETTNNSVLWDNVDFYEEDGFRLDFLPNSASGSDSFATNVGNYYGAGNDVIHAHWATGDFGGVEQIVITKVGGGTFDLNGFLLTSNTDTGGAPASGNEQAFIEGFAANVSTGAAVMLPPEDWGFPAVQILLGANFDAVDEIRFFVTNAVDCFGMDQFFIDEPVTGVPEPSLLLLTGGALAAFAARRRRKQSK